MSQVSLEAHQQNNPVADDVSCLIAIVRPILQGVLHALKEDVVEEAGGAGSVKLKMLPRLYRPGDGDCGICYEYAVHDAVQRRDPMVMEKVVDAMGRCRVPGTETHSLLFGVEKKGASQILATAQNILTDDSRLLTGKQSQPPKLKAYLNQLAAAFRRPSTRLSLPTSINGLWKADLFLGTIDRDRWIGTTVKINPKQLEPANGLRVGIVPASQGRSDRIYKDEGKNLIVCPLPYDGSFMEKFYQAWGIVVQVMHADMQTPKEVALPEPSHRQVARELVRRREFPVLDVIAALEPQSQPELMTVESKSVTALSTGDGDRLIEGLVAPLPKSTQQGNAGGRLRRR